ncbi:chromosomal replication initiator protein [Paenibacillus mucilaginosus]|uniref:DnaA ATPase domain-containing protein n=1 Tax=Paenibacillus mucilaginosus TaxID=61624 RepID=UPI003D1BC3C0
MEQYLEYDAHRYPEYTLNHMIPTSGNRVALAAAQAVSQAPGRSYNPLMLHGATGVGKTHLLHAIGQEIRRSHPDYRILYLTLGELQDTFISAVRNNTIPAYQQALKSVDVLLLDNVHDLAFLESTQELLLEVFEHLLAQHKQIVLASGQPPKLLEKLTSRLQSRMYWGFTCDMACFDPAGFIRDYCRHHGLEDRREWHSEAFLERAANPAEIIAHIRSGTGLSGGQSHVEVPMEERDTGSFHEQVMRLVRGRISPIQYETWFQPCRITKEANCILIQSPSKFAVEWLEDRYGQLLKEAIRSISDVELPLFFELLAPGEGQGVERSCVDLLEDEEDDEEEGLLTTSNDIQRLKELIYEMVQQQKRTNHLLEKVVGLL